MTIYFPFLERSYNGEELYGTRYYKGSFFFISVWRVDFTARVVLFSFSSWQAWSLHCFPLWLLSYLSPQHETPGPPIRVRRMIMSEGVNWETVQMCVFFALRSRPSTASQSDWDHFSFRFKLALWVTRGCAWIYVGHFVCKLAGLQAHADHQNPDRVALHGKTAYVSLDHRSLHRFTPSLLQWYLFL